MTTQAAIPQKWYVPFAQGDGSRVELPVTTADPTRASQTLGFPPLTMQPPESGGVPPQGEDFNGGMNQVARVAWWVLNGGGWPYDASFATNTNIQGYPNGAKLQSADFRGDWISTADGNQNNPDTNGTNWVPGFQYGVTALSSLTGGTVTPTPAQAAKNSITLAGTLASALTVVLPAWLKNWTITNNTTGAFVTIVKTAAGSGVTIPQNGTPTRVSGDGTNIVQVPENVALGTSTTQAAQLGQVAGVVGTSRNVAMNVTTASATATLTADEIVVETALGGVRYCLPSFNKTINLATTGAGGMDTGAAPVSGYVAIYAIYNPTTGTSALLAKNGTSGVQTEVYSGANMPAGFTASALVSVWPTNGSSQLVVGGQNGRTISRMNVLVVNTSSIVTNTAINIAAAVPPNAKAVFGSSGAVPTSGQAAGTVAIGFNITPDAAGATGISGLGAIAGGGLGANANVMCNLAVVQQFYVSTSINTGTGTFTANVNTYQF